jgi:hypothetical protein
MKELSSEIPDGFFLTKIEAFSERYTNKLPVTNFSARVVKKKETSLYSYYLCEGVGLGKEKETIYLNFSLMKGNFQNGKENNKEKLKYLLEKYEYSIKFSSLEIESFCNDVGDENEIHKGESPVVPGLLIIKKSLGEMTTINSLLVNFYKPVYSEQEVFIKKNNNEIFGICEGSLCFKIKIS